MGKLHRAPAGSEIRLVHTPHALHVASQGLHQAGRQHGAAVLVSLAATHRDAALLQVQIPPLRGRLRLDPQPQRLHEPQATAIEQLGHQGLLSIAMT